MIQKLKNIIENKYKIILVIFCVVVLGLLLFAGVRIYVTWKDWQKYQQDELSWRNQATQIINNQGVAIGQIVNFLNQNIKKSNIPTSSSVKK